MSDITKKITMEELDKRYKDAWNKKFKSYNKVMQFLAGLDLSTHSIKEQRERREIMHVAMKEISGKDT